MKAWHLFILVWLIGCTTYDTDQLRPDRQVAIVGMFYQGDSTYMDNVWVGQTNYAPNSFFTSIEDSIKISIADDEFRNFNASRIDNYTFQFPDSAVTFGRYTLNVQINGFSHQARVPYIPNPPLVTVSKLDSSLGGFLGNPELKYRTQVEIFNLDSVESNYNFQFGIGLSRSIIYENFDLFFEGFLELDSLINKEDGLFNVHIPFDNSIIIEIYSWQKLNFHFNAYSDFVFNNVIREPQALIGNGIISDPPETFKSSFTNALGYCGWAHFQVVKM